MAATHRRTRVAAIVSFALVVVTVTGGAFAATPAQAGGVWTVRANPAPSGLAQSAGLQPPAGVTAGCPPGTDHAVTVSWSAAATATSYVVYRSATSSTAGFTAVATGVTATAWTDSGLKKGTYWYAVATVAGTSAWTGPMSSATAARTIAGNGHCS